jgi:hypothetical protein
LNIGFISKNLSLFGEGTQNELAHKRGRGLLGQEVTPYHRIHLSPNVDFRKLLHKTTIFFHHGIANHEYPTSNIQIK